MKRAWQERDKRETRAPKKGQGLGHRGTTGPRARTRARTKGAGQEQQEQQDEDREDKSNKRLATEGHQQDNEGQDNSEKGNSDKDNSDKGSATESDKGSARATRFWRHPSQRL